MGSNEKRIVVTGMGINTPIGDTLDTYYENLIAGKSAISQWSWVNNDEVYSKVGGDLSNYKWKAKRDGLKGKLPAEMHKRLRSLTKKAPFSTKVSCLVAADAWLDAGIGGAKGLDPYDCAVCVGGHNLNEKYLIDNYNVFRSGTTSTRST